jgi:glyoxylase-like metal-dependent hydrolase (beta-lactamase superfamily II)
MKHRRREPAPGVLRLILPLPFPGLDRVNSYALTSSDGVTLVDCGIYDPDPAADHGWEELEDACGAAGFGIGEIVRLVVTHPHIDHYGMAGRLVDAIGCELWMHVAVEDELEIYSDPEAAIEELRAMYKDHGVDDARLDELLGFEDWRAYLSRLILPTRRLTGDESFAVDRRTWEVVHTPGHSASHVCLYRADDELLISGDQLLGSVTPHIDFRRGSDDDPLGDFLSSLERIERLDPVLVLPGHGRPFTDGGERARIVARHHDRRLGAILQVVREQPKTADEITDEIFGTTLLNFHRRLALGEALAHLAYLRKRREIERFRDDDGNYRYRKPVRRREEEPA